MKSIHPETLVQEWIKRYPQLKPFTLTDPQTGVAYWSSKKINSFLGYELVPYKGTLTPEMLAELLRALEGTR